MKGGYCDENSFSLRNEDFSPSPNTETESSKRFQFFLKMIQFTEAVHRNKSRGFGPAAILSTGNTVATPWAFQFGAV
jgi:hypothetical protein